MSFEQERKTHLPQSRALERSLWQVNQATHKLKKEEGQQVLALRKVDRKDEL